MYAPHIVVRWQVAPDGSEWVDCIDGQNRRVHIERPDENDPLVEARYVMLRGKRAYLGAKPAEPEQPPAVWQETKGHGNGFELLVNGVRIASVHYDASMPKGSDGDKWIVFVGDARWNKRWENSEVAKRVAEKAALKKYGRIYMALSAMEGTLR